MNALHDNTPAAPLAWTVKRETYCDNSETVYIDKSGSEIRYCAECGSILAGGPGHLVKVQIGPLALVDIGLDLAAIGRKLGG